MTFRIIVDGMKEGIKFSASHFLVDHSKCSRLHGHNYYISAEIEGKLDEYGFVIDFAVIKEELRRIADLLDHRTLIPDMSENIFKLFTSDSIYLNFMGKWYMFPLKDIYLLHITSTSGENLAKYISSMLKSALILKYSINTSKYEFEVRVSETKGNIAIFKDDVGSKSKESIKSDMIKLISIKS